MILRAAILTASVALTAAAAGASNLRSLTDRSDILGWEAVGRIDDGDRGGTCTGALIAPNLVLTAAHCIVRPGEDGRRDPTALLFRAGYRDGETIATVPVARAVVHPGFDPDSDDFREYLVHDAALLELAEPIPATTASPFRLTGLGAIGATVSVVSFGRSRMNAASRQRGCRIIARDYSGVIVFDCAGEPGSSGAPIFDMSGPAPRIMALISSGGPYGGIPSVFGATLTDTVADLKRALRTGEGVWPETKAPVARRLSGTANRETAGSARFVRP